MGLTLWSQLSEAPFWLGVCVPRVQVGERETKYTGMFGQMTPVPSIRGLGGNVALRKLVDPA